MFVRPRTGLKIRDPDLKDHLPVSGRDVPENEYWHRRIRDNDVTTEPLLEGAPSFSEHEQ